MGTEASARCESGENSRTNRREAGVVKTALLALLMLSVALGVAGSAQAGPHLYLDVGGDGPNGNMQLFTPKTISVFASEIPVGSDGLGLFGFGFNLTFDPIGLSADTAIFGPLFSFTGFESTSNGVGSVGATSNRFFQFAGPSGDDILLATIQFSPLTEGTFGLTLSHFTGPGDNTLFDFSILDGDLSFFGSGSIVVTPEPGTAALLGFGLLLLAGSRRRD